MDAIVTAGGVPKEGDPLYEYTQGAPKAMLDLAGKPMVQWVLDALSESQAIERVVVVGLDEDLGLYCSKPLFFIPNQGSMLENIYAGANKILSLNPNAGVLLSVSSDIPAITGEIVDWMVSEIEKGEYDVYYNVITRQDMENRFPGSKRSFTRFKDVEVCGGDMTAFRASMLNTEGSVWQELIGARKNVFRQAAIIGFGTLFLLALRQLTLDDAVERVAKRLQIHARAIRCPYPELGMDVDKPFQMDLLHAELAQREAL